MKKRIPKKYQDNNDLAVVMTVRNNLQYLKLAMRSLESRKSGKINIHYFIYNDGSSDESMEWLLQWSKKHNVNMTIDSNPNIAREYRQGITGGTLKAMELAKLSKITRYFLIHADMVFPFNWDLNIVKYMIPKRIVSATRIEPPIFGAEPCKIQKNFGNHAMEFGIKNQIKYLWYVWKNYFITKRNKHLPTKGAFAPYGGYIVDWEKHKVDIHIGPQSHEETDAFYRMRLDNYDFLQTWDVLVYHFGGRGDRFKTTDLSKFDNDWSKQNNKSMQNFIRKWGQIPLMDDWSFPVLLYPIKESISLNLLIINGEHNIFSWLEYYEPWFDNIVISIDDRTTDNTEKEIQRFIDSKKDKKYSYYFQKNKIQVFKRKLNNDFGKAHNYMIRKSTSQWIVHIDIDEKFPISMLNGLRGIIPELKKQKKTICGFPRTNLVDGQPFNPNNPDVQFRLYRKGTKWVNAVHEIPEKIIKKIEIPAVCATFGKIVHAKSSTEHNSGQDLYDSITNGAGNRRV